MKYIGAKLLHSNYLEADFFNELGTLAILFFVLVLFVYFKNAISLAEVQSYLNDDISHLEDTSSHVSRLIGIFSYLGRMSMWCMGGGVFGKSGPHQIGGEAFKQANLPTDGMTMISYCGLYLHMSYFLSPVYTMLRVAIVERLASLALMAFASVPDSVFYFFMALFVFKPLRGFSSTIISALMALRFGLPLSIMVAHHIFPPQSIQIPIYRDLVCDYGKKPWEMLGEIRQSLEPYIFGFSFSITDGHLDESNALTFAMMKYLIYYTIFYPTILLTGMAGTLYGFVKLLGTEADVQLLARLMSWIDIQHWQQVLALVFFILPSAI